MARVLWINGSFGVGKTTTATLVQAENANLRFYDPETVGYLLRMHIADLGVTDFQHWPSWRRLVPVVAEELASCTGQDLIAVQTVLVEEHWRELASGLATRGLEVFHVVLEAAEPTMQHRIASDRAQPGAAAWRRDHIPAYTSARRWLAGTADLVLDTTELTPVEAAQRVTAAFEAG